MSVVLNAGMGEGGMRGDRHCGICGKPIKEFERPVRYRFNLCHVECVEAIEDADYADHVNGVPS